MNDVRPQCHTKEEASTTSTIFTEGLVVGNSREPWIPMAMNDAHPQWHTKEEASTTSTIFTDGLVVGNAREPNLVRKFSEPSSHGRNTMTSALEQSFKAEEYIYVRFLYFLLLWSSKMIKLL